PLPREVVCWIRRRTAEPVEAQMSFDVAIADADGRDLAEIEGFTVGIIDVSAPAPSAGLAVESDAAGDGGELQHDDYLLSPDEALGVMDAPLRQDQADHVVLSRRPLGQRAMRIERHLQQDE